MTRTRTTAIVLAMILVLLPGVVAAQGPKAFTPGAPGLGDPYFPLDGNGGYDVDNYLLDVQYDPATDVLTGVATITATATQNLSSFNLDFVGLTVRSVTVDGKAATWTHEAGELTITPADGIRNHTRFVAVIAYDGVPQTIEDLFGISGFIHTDDGALVVGEPHVAATWFPANDHPTDKASFTFRVTVPDGLEVVANGTLEGQASAGGWTTFEWQASDPMATYLAGMGIGQFDVSAYRNGRIQYWDAIDPDLFAPFAVPVSGDQFAYSQQADFSYKRLTREITVPDEGADVSFWVTRDTEPGWDFFFVEARTAGEDDWTTLPDENGATSQDTGFVCPFSLELHPFLEHYQTALPDEDPEDEFPPTCEPSGTSGDWWAATGASDGWEQWSVDLSDWAGETVEISLSYASDDVVQFNGVAIDDIVVSTGEGSTSFEADGDVMDGWTVPGAPEGSPGNDNDWTAATVADLPPSRGEIAQGSLARQPEIISFLEANFGKYPFKVAGGIIDDFELGFALENQTRPIYAPVFFTDPISGDAVIVHELAHQWFGDSVAVEQWQHIWLNEGFATYAEWLWAEYEGFGTTQESFDFWYELIPAEDPLWSVVIGDPGPDLLFDFAVYIRGAMTLHQLRLAVGDEAFFTILQRWAREQRGGNVSTPEFIALAEQVSGQQLDELFDVWLFTPEKPVLADAERNVEPLSPDKRVTPRVRMPGDRIFADR